MKISSLIGLLSCVLLAGQVQAQFKTAKPEVCYNSKLHPFSAANANSGTDGSQVDMNVSIGGANLHASYAQVTVWDGLQGGIGVAFYDNNNLTTGGNMLTFQARFTELPQITLNGDLKGCHKVCIAALEQYNLADPDVSVATQGNTLRIAVTGVLTNSACIDKNECPDLKGRVVVLRYVWNDGAESPEPIDIWGVLGTVKAQDPNEVYPIDPTSPFISYRSCSSPNIDCNSTGSTAVVWTESGRAMFPAEMPFSSNPAYFPIDEGNVFCVTGDIFGGSALRSSTTDKLGGSRIVRDFKCDGTCKINEDPIGAVLLGGQKDNSITVDMPLHGLQVLQQPGSIKGDGTNSFVYFRNFRGSDVSITEGRDDAIISIVYMESMAFPPQAGLSLSKISQLMHDNELSGGEQLVVAQREYGIPYIANPIGINSPSDFPRRFDGFVAVPNTGNNMPRIASPMIDRGRGLRSESCAVIMGDDGGGCAPEGFYYESQIKLYVLLPILESLNNGSTPNWSGIAANEQPSTRRYGNSSPVVDYVGQDEPRIIAAWQVTASPHVCNDLNIVGRTFSEIGGYLPNSLYSLVNPLTRFNQMKPAIGMIKNAVAPTSEYVAGYSYFSQHALPEASGMKVGISALSPGNDEMQFLGRNTSVDCQ